MENQEYQEYPSRPFLAECSECGNESENVSLVLDPFKEEVEGRQVWRLLCARCYQTLCDEI